MKGVGIPAREDPAAAPEAPLPGWAVALLEEVAVMPAELEG